MSQSHSQLWFKSTNHMRNCSLNQPITTLVSVTIEKVNRLLHWGFLQNGEFSPLKNDSIIEDNMDFVYPMAQNDFGISCIIMKRIGLNYSLTGLVYKFI